MPQSHSPLITALRQVTNDSDVTEGLCCFCNSLGNLLQNRIVAVYLYGSLANGCFNGITSDVDLLVILNAALSSQEKESLLELNLASSIPIDATYATREEVNKDVTPTPLQCVIRPKKLFTLPNGHSDFPLVRQDTYSNGVQLIGPPIRKLINPVPWDLQRRCILDVFPSIRERFKSSVLMLCRIVCTMTTRRPCSKAQAGQWALRHFSSSWYEMIARALEQYASGTTQTGIREEDILLFEEYCQQQLTNL